MISILDCLGHPAKPELLQVLMVREKTSWVTFEQRNFIVGESLNHFLNDLESACRTLLPYLSSTAKTDIVIAQDTGMHEISSVTCSMVADAPHNVTLVKNCTLTPIQQYIVSENDIAISLLGVLLGFDWQIIESRSGRMHIKSASVQMSSEIFEALSEVFAIGSIPFLQARFLTTQHPEIAIDSLARIHLTSARIALETLQLRFTIPCLNPADISDLDYSTLMKNSAEIRGWLASTFGKLTLSHYLLNPQRDPLHVKLPTVLFQTPSFLVTLWSRTKDYFEIEGWVIDKLISNAALSESQKSNLKTMLA